MSSNEIASSGGRRLRASSAPATSKRHASIALLFSGAVTPKSFTQALKTDKNVNTFGLTPPYNGGVRNVDGESCVSNGTFVRAEVSNGQIVAFKRGQFIDVATDKVVASK